VSDASIAELLMALAGVFAARRMRWYVFGAQAVVAYGRPRLTADVDVMVDAGGTKAAELARVLSGAGFALRFPLSTERDEDPRLLPLVHTASSIPVDLVIAAPGLDQELLERAVSIDLGGALVPVVSAADLVALKVLAGRRKDLEDVRGVLLEQGPRLDLARTRALIRAFAAATENPGLVARLERLVRAARAPRRG
jgi:hypothetical protein